MLEADVAIVGAGPAGIAAAIRSAEAGQQVLVLDEAARPGGQIWRHGMAPPPPAARTWLDRLQRSGARLLTQAAVTDARMTDGARRFELVYERDGTASVVRAGAIVLATGARERFLPFPGWTLPGVVGIGGAQALLKAGASFSGKRVVIAGSGPLLLPVAASLSRAGAHLTVVAEQAVARKVAAFAAGLWRNPAMLFQAARYRASFAGTRYAMGTWVSTAAGDDRVREVTLTDGARRRTIPCDFLCTGYGLVPNTELARLLGCATARGTVVVSEGQETSMPGAFAAGEPTGIGGVELALIEGEIAGLCASARCGEARALYSARSRAREQAAALERSFALRPELRTLARDDTIVCRCEDVTRGQLRPDWTTRQAKLYTRVGMGPCQGRICGAALEVLFGWEPDVTRPPLQPARISTLLAEGVPSPTDHETHTNGVV